MQALKSHSADVTVIIVSYNTAHLLARLFDQLLRSGRSLEKQIIVVDNASRDDSVEILRDQYPQVEVIANRVNVGFGRANNQALGRVRGRYVLLLNTDAFVSPDTLEKTVTYMDAHPDCGVLGVQLIGDDGKVQPSCRYFPTPWNVFAASQGLKPFFPAMRLVDDPSWDPALQQECDWVPGCYYLIRREVIESIGLFDPRFFLYYEEVDHCRRVKAAGWKVMYYADTKVVHIGGESAGSIGEVTQAARQIPALQIESELLYFRKYYGAAGFVLGVCLMTLSGLLDAARAMIKGMRIKAATAAVCHAFRVLTLSARTRLGTRSTR